MYVRELFQKSGVIDIVAKYREPRVAEIEVRAVRRRRSCQQVTTGSSWGTIIEHGGGNARCGN